MHKIGISWNCCGNLPCEEQIELMLKNGFEATFLPSDAPQLDAIVAKLRANSIDCESCHAPFADINSIWMSGEAGDTMLEKLIRSAENCARNQIPVMVVHLSSGDNAPRVGDIGNARFDKLMEAAKVFGVKIAFENLRKLGNLAHAMEQYPEAGFCWDVGHESCFTPDRRYMPLFGNRIVALHLHDNHGIYDHDEHLIPYDGSIDMEQAAKTLAQSGYRKAIMLELLRSQSELYAQTDAEAFYARAAKAARKFAKYVEKYSK